MSRSFLPVVLGKRWIPSVKDLPGITLHLVETESEHKSWLDLVRKHHPLGVPQGSSLKYFARAGEQIIAAFSFAPATYKLRARDRLLRKVGLVPKEEGRAIAVNTRFLILPWVRARNLGSSLLSRAVRRVREDWPIHYDRELILVETFVDPERYFATSYRAANWVFLGHTYGSGVKGGVYIQHGKPKAIFVFPLARELRRTLRSKRRRAEIIGDRAELPSAPSPSLPENWRADEELLADLDEAAVRQLAHLLVEFHEEFAPAFRRIEQRRSGLRYLAGLLSAARRKNAERIALELEGPKAVRALQRFLKNNRWDEEEIDRKLRRKAAELLNDPDGMIAIDSSEFPKKGDHSVGVARQYCGRLGKVENCQSAVFLSYGGTEEATLIASELYLPRSWFSEEKRKQWAKCDIPEDAVFRTKLEIAREQVEKVWSEGVFQARWIGCDCFFGRSLEFLESLPGDLWFFAQIPSDTRVLLAPAEDDAKPVTVAKVAKSKAIAWRIEKLADGAKGPVYAKMARVRVSLIRDGQGHGPYWLFFRKDADGTTKYYLSDAPENTPFEEMKKPATMRWRIEECFRLGKQQAGMDEYETRSLIAWNRHMLYVRLALLFLLTVRARFSKKTASR